MSQTKKNDQEASQKIDQNDPAFEVVDINTETGETTLVIQKGIVGAMANQLKNTSNRRKAASILRKMGYVLAECGDVQYGGSIEETELDPHLVSENQAVNNGG
jgi:hypothetical protein